MIEYRYKAWKDSLIELISISIISQIYFLLLVRTLKLYSFRKILLYNTVLLTIVIMGHILFPHT